MNEEIFDFESNKELYEQEKAAFAQILEESDKQIKEIEKGSKVAKGSKKGGYDHCQMLYLQGYEVSKIAELTQVEEKQIKRWAFDKDWENLKAEIEYEKTKQLKEAVVDEEVAKGKKVLEMVSPIVYKLCQAALTRFQTDKKMKDMTTKEILTSLNNLATLQAKLTGELVEQSNHTFDGPGGIWRTWADEHNAGKQIERKHVIEGEAILE